MAKEPDNIVHELLRDIRAKQDEHAAKLGVVEAVAQHVAELRADMQEVRDDVRGIRGEVQEVRDDVRGIRGELEVVHADSHDMRAEIHEIRGEMNEMREDIRAVQADTKEVRRVVADHSLRFDFLDERVEMLREGTLTAIGFAANASQSQKKLQEQIADLTKRVEKLERVK